MPAPAEVVALAATWLAAAVDARTRRIPNWLSAGAALLGLITHAALALSAGEPVWPVLLRALGTASLLLLGFSLLAALGWLGFGDAKLLGAIGACVGWELALRVVPCVLLSGGCLALVLAARQGDLPEVLRNLSHPRAMAHARVDGTAQSLHLFAFGTAIALGTTWAVAGRYLPGIAVF